ATAAAGGSYSLPWLAGASGEMALRLGVATVVFFLVNTAPVALVIALSESRPFVKTWWACDFWSFPYYLGGAAVAQLVSVAEHYVGWQWILLTGPVVYLIYRSYRL